MLLASLSERCFSRSSILSLTEASGGLAATTLIFTDDAAVAASWNRAFRKDADMDCLPTLSSQSLDERSASNMWKKTCNRLLTCVFPNARAVNALEIISPICRRASAVALFTSCWKLAIFVFSICSRFDSRSPISAAT